MMRSKRAWLIMLAAIVMLQALVRPAANVLSLRDDGRSILSRISAEQHHVWFSTTGVAGIVAPDYRCGFPVDMERLERRVGEIDDALRGAAERIYAGDLLTAATGSLSPSEVRLWQLRYGLGLWSGRLDDGPVSDKEVQKARDFAAAYFDTRLRQVACDTARGMLRQTPLP